MSRNTTLFCLSFAIFSIVPVTAQTPQAARRTPVVAMVEKVAPAVVNISAESTVREVAACCCPSSGGRFVYTLDFAL